MTGAEQWAFLCHKSAERYGAPFETPAVNRKPRSLKHLMDAALKRLDARKKAAKHERRDSLPGESR